MDFIKDNLEKINVLVVGDVMLDTYFWGNVKRISPEAPVPIVHVSESRNVLGGAANVARNIATLGANVHLIGCIGRDENASLLKKNLSDRQIENTLIETDFPTINKIRIVGDYQQIVRVDFEEESPFFNAEVEKSIVDKVVGLMKKIDVIIISDYKKGTCTKSICENIIKLANENNCPIVVDPKGKDWNKYKGATVITPNLKELIDVFGNKVNNEDNAISSVGRQIIDDYELKSLLVTRSEKGMSLIEGGTVEHVKTDALEVFDVSGAGDTVVATLAVCMAIGLSLKESVIISNKAAGIVVSKIGTAPIYYSELKHNLNKTGYRSNKVISNSELTDVLSVLREDGKKIVFTNGCFDILHKGHVCYLREARKKGDVFILGLNSDVSVKRLKGDTRPINNEQDRAFMLSAFDFIDYIVVFSEDTPSELIKIIAPDVLVKGGDYRIEDVVGREFAKETVLINFQEGYSSTILVNKIKQNK